MPKTLVKDGREVLVFSATQEVNLRAQGFTEPVDVPAEVPAEEPVVEPPTEPEPEPESAEEPTEAE